MERGVIRETRAISQAIERPVGHLAERRGGRRTVVVDAGALKHRLETIWAGRGWPADVRAAIASVPSPWPREIVVVAERLSQGSLQLLRERDANWVDEEGQARIVTPSGLIVVREARSETEQPQAAGFRWSPSAVDIGELLISKAGSGTMTATEIAMQSHWSHPQTTKVLRHFSARGLVEKIGPARGRGVAWQLANPAALLDAWAEHVIEGRRERVLAHRALRDPMGFLREELAPTLTDLMLWAASGWAGLEATAPFVTAVPVLHIYVAADAISDGRLDAVMRTTGLRKVDEGARVEFWSASNVALELVHEAAALPIASPPRVYADLRSLGGRGAEAAQHVREELIGF